MDRYDLQSYALLAMARLPNAVQPRKLPLAVPRCVFDTGGGAISHLYKEIFVNRVYELAEPVPVGGRILDAGAHVGMAALYFLHNHPGAKVVSIEANPATAEVLRQNLSPWADRAEVVERALSDHDGQTSFYVSGGTGINVNAGMTNREHSDAPVTEMRVFCLDVRHLFKDGGFAFAKLDIEGGEYAVLQTEHFHPDNVRGMIVEFHDIADHREAFDTVRSELTETRGYRLRDVHHRPLSERAIKKLSGSALLRFEHPDAPPVSS